MPKAKAAKSCNILPWLSGNADCREGRFIQVGNSLFLNKRFQALKDGAQILYLRMADESGGKLEFEFTAACAKKHGIAKSSFERRKKELIDAGFIELVGGSGRATREPNRYRFSIAWKARPPTRE